MKNESAFPVHDSSKTPNYSTHAYLAGGLTKREMAAIMILSGSMGNDQYVAAFADQVKGDPYRMAKTLSTQSVILADALIAELERTKERVDE